MQPIRASSAPAQPAATVQATILRDAIHETCKAVIARLDRHETILRKIERHTYWTWFILALPFMVALLGVTLICVAFAMRAMR